MEYFGKVQKRLAYEASSVKQKIQLANTLKKASSQFTLIKDLINPFYMIGIPGSLHIMKLCAKYIPEYVNTVLVLNGMDEWEEEKARSLLSPKRIVRLNHSGVVPHGKVLDMLFRNMQNPFGIIDYDCFIFNAGMFSQITSLEPDVIVNSLFSKESPVFWKNSSDLFLLFPDRNRPVNHSEIQSQLWNYQFFQKNSEKSRESTSYRWHKRRELSRSREELLRHPALSHLIRNF